MDSRDYVGNCNCDECTADIVYENENCQIAYSSCVNDGVYLRHYEGQYVWACEGCYLVYELLNQDFSI